MAVLASGKNTSFRVYWNSKIWTVLVKTWSIEEVAVEFAEGVNGESRDRLGKVTNYYKFTFDCFEDGSSKTLANVLQNQANDDANLPQLAMAAGVLFSYNDGTKEAFTLGGGILGPYKGGSGGRTERFMHNLTGRATTFQPVAAV